MQRALRTGTIAAAVAALLVPLAARAQSTGQTASGIDSAFAARAEALANVEANRSAVISQTLERWRSEFAAPSAARNYDGGAAEFGRLLKLASAEKLLAASQAESYADALSSLRPNRGPDFIRLEPGSVIPHVLGDTGDDLVFTPITPCRIVDTRFATGGWAGKVGPNSGNWYSVNLADFTAQGGASSCPGMPTSFNPGAVAINVTSTGQTGAGNLRVVACGAGTPLVSLLNYTPGVNLANAAVVASAVGTCTLGPPAGAGPNDIYVYSGVSTSDVIVDIMGYFAPPVATALDCYTTAATTQAVGAGANFGISPPACAAGYFQASVGCRSASYNSANWAIIGYYVPGTSDGSCWGTNITGGTLNYQAFGRCCRVPGQ
jgi:hypothetical protein